MCRIGPMIYGMRAYRWTARGSRPGTFGICRSDFRTQARPPSWASEQAARRIVIFQMPDGESIEADERYFLIRADNLELSDER
jgi:hypothetical protein